jgi:hypothetical protein
MIRRRPLAAVTLVALMTATASAASDATTVKFILASAGIYPRLIDQ